MKKNNTFYLTSESKQKNRKEFLNTKQFLGETLAFGEVFGIKNYKIHRSPISLALSYIQL